VADHLFDEHLVDIGHAAGRNMTRTKNFDELRQRLRSDPKARAQIDEYRDALRAVLALNGLRVARGVAHAELAEAWEVPQIQTQAASDRPAARPAM
jgi:hypothetical protein